MLVKRWRNLKGYWYSNKTEDNEWVTEADEWGTEAHKGLPYST
jgi:hypothetical protein